MNDDDLTTLIRDHATRHGASERLRAGVRTQVALQAAARADERKTTWRWRGVGWRTAAAGFASGVALTLGLVGVLPRIAWRESLPAELVADHVRALGAGPLIQVASSDHHTVKPWFQGQLDYAPPVIDLAADGFPLLGGRVERIDGAAVAALVYASNRHIISVFVWPADGDQSPQRSQYRGFNLQHWDDGTMRVWIVSDLEAGELERLGHAWRVHQTAR